MNYYKRHLGDYAKKTRTLTVLQHGIYTLLLDLYYSEEAPVTATDAYTVCQARTAKDRAAVDTILTKFFTQDRDLWRNPKADEVIAKYHAKAPKNAESGRLGGLAKAQRNASETLDERQPDADISQKPELSNQKKQKKKDYGAVAPEPWIPLDAWSAFCEHRRVKRSAIGTEHTVKLIVDELLTWRAQGVAPEVVLNYAIKNGHTGLYYKPENSNGNKTNRSNPSLAERAAEAERLADEHLGPL